MNINDIQSNGNIFKNTVKAQNIVQYCGKIKIGYNFYAGYGAGRPQNKI